MKFFLDTAKVEEIRAATELGICDGVTTNPTLIMKSGRSQEEVVKEIAQIVRGPVSVEVIAEDAPGMVKEAEEFSAWASNIVIKVPMTKEGMKAVRILSEKGIKTNVTLVFSATQALIAAKAGATYISPFVGRLDDVSSDGMELIEQIMDILDNYEFETELIVASVRDPIHVVEAARLGAHIATIPAGVLEKMWNHPLTDKGIAQFLEDYEKSKKE
ncbi:fructose-6-phosphate aldolase [Candidatus Micrarchaeota archaeon]|nr:fructose-6-phosphate aldolase [Candidatus Micrarchaeota archaeon]